MIHVTDAEAVAIAFSILGLAVAITGIIVAIKIYNKQKESDEKLKRLVEDIGDIISSIGSLTIAQTTMVTTMSELITQQNQRFESRKNHHEEQCVHALAEIRRKTLIIAESVAKGSLRDIKELKKIWQMESAQKYLDELIKTGFDVLENDVKDDISILKAELEHELSLDFDSEIGRIGSLASIINRLLTSSLQPARLRLIELQNKTMGDIIQRRKSQGLTEKVYKSEIMYKRSLSHAYRYPSDPPYPLLDSEIKK